MLPLLTQERRIHGLTQASLAQTARISLPTLRGLERGRGSIRSLLRVMKALDLHWGWVPTGAQPASRIMKRRQELGLSQADLARRVGCARGTIVDLEKDLGGSVPILLSVLSALALNPPLCSNRRSETRGLVPATNAPERDRVMTPPELAAAILAHFEGQMTGRVLDPARGQGAFYHQFPEHLEKHWCELSEGHDFLDWKEPVDWIVTNPPWSRLRDFTQHAMTLASNIIWLAPMVNLTTKARLRDLEAAGFGIAELVMIDTPKDWPQSGFQLVAAHLKKGQQGDCKFGKLG